MLDLTKNITKGKSFNVNNHGTKSFFSGGLNLQHEALNFDPLVTGYAFIVWTRLPRFLVKAWKNCDKFFQLTQSNFKSLQGLSDIEIGAEAYQYGFANNEYNVAAGVTKGNTEITLKHQEYSGSPITEGYTYWASGIRDPETGISPYPLITGMDYAARNHTAELLYIVTRPDANNFKDSGNNIEFCAYFTNVWPTKIPLAHYNFDQADKSLVEIEMTLKCNMHMGPKVNKYAASMISKLYAFKTDPIFDPTTTGYNIITDANTINQKNIYNDTLKG